MWWNPSPWKPVEVEQTETHHQRGEKDLPAKRDIKDCLSVCFGAFDY